MSAIQCLVTYGTHKIVVAVDGERRRPDLIRSLAQKQVFEGVDLEPSHIMVYHAGFETDVDLTEDMILEDKALLKGVQDEQQFRTPVYEKRGPKWCIASPGGPRRVQTYPGLGSTTRMPFSPDTGSPRTARRGWVLATFYSGSVVSPMWLGSVVTLLTKHLAPKVQAPPAGLGVRGDATLQTPAFTGSMRYTNLQDTTPRTSAGVLRDMKLALSLGGTFPVNGYFGPSPAVNLPHFNLVWGFTVEYMHAVLLGVVRQITELLLSSSNSQERYYVGNTASLAVINSRLAEIKPPHSFTRLPRALSTRTFWKASEWRHWLRYYWLPCMYGVLPDQYWLHIKKLVETIHALLRDTVTPASIDVAGGTCESRCLESGVSTDPEPCGFARPRLAVRGFPVSGEKGILVVEPSPGQGSPSEPLKVTHTQSPSCSKGAVPSKEGTTPSKVPEVSSAALAGPSGRGRGLSPRASCSHLKPMRTEQPPPPPKGPTLSPDEKMDESLPLSEDDQSLPETESPPLVFSEVLGRPKDTSKKKTIPRVEAPKAP
ncbi:uncharacterized protein ISCGN_030177 [Ixodes scapularis]